MVKEEATETKNFYHDGIWETIVSHPQYDLGRRELEALVRFMPVVAHHTADGVNILHLGVGNGREVSLFVSHLKVGKYVLNNICAPSLERVAERVRVACPAISFSEEGVVIKDATPFYFMPPPAEARAGREFIFPTPLFPFRPRADISTPPPALKEQNAER